MKIGDKVRAKEDLYIFCGPTPDVLAGTIGTVTHNFGSENTDIVIVQWPDFGTGVSVIPNEDVEVVP